MDLICAYKCHQKNDESRVNLCFCLSEYAGKHGETLQHDLCFGTVSLRVGEIFINILLQHDGVELTAVSHGV